MYGEEQKMQNQQLFSNYQPFQFGAHGNTDTDDLPRKTAAVVQPMTIHRPFLHTPEKETEPMQQTAVLPTKPTGTEVMLDPLERTPNLEIPCGDAGSAYSHVFPYTCRDLYKPYPDTNLSTSPKHEIDVVNDSQEHLRTGDAPNNTDSSISTLGSTSSSPASTDSAPSPSGSVASPESGSGSTTSPDIPQGPPKKKARTNYSPSQVQALERVFHENPYPDPEMMETLSKDLGIPEGKLKIWFQNKRARWRRRANRNAAFHPQMMQMPPALSPVSPYGMMPHSPMMMTSSPMHMMPGYFPYSSSPSRTQGQLSPLATPTTSYLQQPTNQPIYSQHQPSRTYTQSLFQPTQNLMSSTQQMMASSQRGYSQTLYPFPYKV